MENHEIIDSEYQKGFNEGYVLARHNRELAEKIAEALKETERGRGIAEGCKEFAKEKDAEKTKIKLPDWLKKDKLKSIEKEKTKDKDFHDKA